MDKFYKFPHISSFEQMLHYWRRFRPELTQLRYRGTVKLHGTNAGISRIDGIIRCQSRNRPIVPGNDNAGFAAFVRAIPSHNLIKLLDACLGAGQDGVLYGEWVGRGIQARVAVSELQKHFAIFAWAPHDGAGLQAVASRPRPRGTHQAWCNSFGVHFVSDAGESRLTIDRENMAGTEALLLDRTRQVAAKCPHSALQGVSGIGEGIVWTPLDPVEELDLGLWFKTKGDLHCRATPRLPRPSATIPGAAERFAIASVAARHHQALGHLADMGWPIDRTSTGHYLKWVLSDIRCESEAELERLQLTWKQASKAVAREARQMWLTHLSAGGSN